LLVRFRGAHKFKWGKAFNGKTNFNGPGPILPVEHFGDDLAFVSLLDLVIAGFGVDFATAPKLSG
jgi:hypothetical protein